MSENILSSVAANDENASENALRPKSLIEFVGQQRVRDQVSVLLQSAKSRGVAADHMLLSGPPGLGKTTLAFILAEELGAPIRISSGPAITHAGDLAAILSSLTEGEILFLDEIHRLTRPAEELLYLAMEDFRVDVIVGKGPGATAIPLDLPKFTLVGATTRAGLLPAPLRDRFGFTAHLDFYEDAELAEIIKRSAKLLSVEIDGKSIAEIAGRARGTPRIANRLLRRVRDYALVKNSSIDTKPVTKPDIKPDTNIVKNSGRNSNVLAKVDLETTKLALEMYEVDLIGLDRLDRAVLKALVERFNGGPVGLSTLAIAVGEETETVEAVAEPFLVRTGLMARTARGRVATPAGFSHLGHKPPQGWSLFDSSE